MNAHRTLLLLAIGFLPILNSHGQKPPNNQAAEQSDFSYELDIYPVRKPIALPAEALQELAKASDVRSCLDNENLAPENLPAKWFLASEIHLDGDKEIDLIVLPGGRLPDTPPGEVSLGPNTGGFWVLRHTPSGFALVLSEMAHDLEVLQTRSHGLRDIRLSTIALSEHTIQDYRFDGRRYQLFRTRTEPNG